MKVLRLFATCALTALAITAVTSTAVAQGGIAPNQQFGIGINTNGFQLQYALSPGMQIGMDIVLKSGEGATGYGFAPYFRALLEGTVNPFIQAGLSYARVTVRDDVTGANSGVDQTMIYAGFGLEYFINRNVGVWAGGNVLNIGLDPKGTYFGFFDPVAGVEWYFNP